MNKLVILGCVLFLTVSCGDDDQACVMKEAIVSYPVDDLHLKRVFTHDGTNYTEIHDYLYDDVKKDFNETPYQVITFTYTNGKVSKTIKHNPQNSDNAYVESTFTYTVVDEITIIHVHEVFYLDDTILLDRMIERHFVESPRDDFYLTKNEIGEPILEHYENGNLINVGFQSDTGTHVAYDTTWAFTLHYNYDNKPNAINEYVLLDLISYVPNYGYCTNNMIELITNPDTQPVSIKQQFNLKSGNKLDKYVYEGTGRTVTINYDCK